MASGSRKSAARAAKAPGSRAKNTRRRGGDNTVVLAAVGDVATPAQPPAHNFDYVLDELRAADIRFAQVERVYTKRGTFQEQGNAPHVKQHPRMAKAFAKVPFHVVSVGSNHTGDWGPDGAEDTVKTFHGLGIKTVGAGSDIREARKPAIIRRKGLTFAFLGYCSVLLPQYWATETRAGATPMRARTFYEPYEYQPGAPVRVVTMPNEADLEAFCHDIAKAKKRADHVVVSLHWGVHFIAKPLADYQPLVAHAAIDAGASVILGSHPHLLQATEIYKNAVIFYSLGNFSFYRRPGSPNFCCPMGEFEFKDAYDKEMDPGQSFPARRHGHEGRIALVEFDRRGVRHADFLPTEMDDKGRPRPIAPDRPEFEKYRRYAEWVSDEIPGGVNHVPARDGRYVMYQR